MWLTVPVGSMPTRSRSSGTGIASVTVRRSEAIYSIEGHGRPKRDFFGYEWHQPQVIGLLGYHTGAVDENGGRFTSPQVEYLDTSTWKPVHGLQISPPLAPGDLPFNKPRFVDYLLAFRPVETTGIRIVGDAERTEHWRSELTFFTSISQLTARGPLPRYELLNR